MKTQSTPDRDVLQMPRSEVTIRESMDALERQRRRAEKLGELDIACEFQDHICSLRASLDKSATSDDSVSDGASTAASGSVNTTTSASDIASEDATSNAVMEFFKRLRFSPEEAESYSSLLAAGGFTGVDAICENAELNDFIRAGVPSDHAARLAVAVHPVRAGHLCPPLSVTFASAAPVETWPEAGFRRLDQRGTGADPSVLEFLWGGRKTRPSSLDVLTVLDEVPRVERVKLSGDSLENAVSLLLASADARNGPPCPRTEVNTAVAALVAEALQECVDLACGSLTYRLRADGAQLLLGVVSVETPIVATAPISAQAEAIGAELHSPDLERGAASRFLTQRIKCAAALKVNMGRNPVPLADRIAVDGTCVPTRRGSDCAARGWFRQRLSSRRGQTPPSSAAMIRREHLGKRSFAIVDCLTAVERNAGVELLAEQLCAASDCSSEVSLGLVTDSSSNPVVAACVASAYAIVAGAVLGVESVLDRPLEVVEIHGCRGAAVQFGAVDDAECVIA